MIVTGRRQLIANSALIGAGLALPGCVEGGPRSAGGRAACLPRVQVSPARVIRTMAGLRPYRASGFVVRADAVAGKRLVHNYGHGGAGITLSWGTSRLARDLGLPGHNGPVAVLGAGIVGLTMARLVQEAGFPVTLYAAALPPATTSNVAGGQWHPASLYVRDQVTPAWLEQYRAAMDYSFRRFQIMTGDEYGIRWLPTYQEVTDQAHNDDLAMAHEVDAEVLEPGRHPFAAGTVRRYTTMYAETGHLLRQLIRDVQIAGGRIVIREFASPADVAALPETLVFNCTGLGAGKLFGDTVIEPVRGQLAILLPQPEVQYAFVGQMGYMFPRADGIICGGTAEHGEWDATPQPETIARILAKHQAFFTAMKC